jgi:hypothetical protein
MEFPSILWKAGFRFVHAVLVGTELFFAGLASYFAQCCAWQYSHFLFSFFFLSIEAAESAAEANAAEMSGFVSRPVPCV